MNKVTKQGSQTGKDLLEVLARDAEAGAVAAGDDVGLPRRAVKQRELAYTR
jgi:hypothetical protein